jgi:hypothetical protein
LRAIVEGLAKAKIPNGDNVPDLLEGQRDRSVREESYEESADPVWVTRAEFFAAVTVVPRTMFELQSLAKRLWGWRPSFVENIVERAERLELIEYANPPYWRKKETMVKPAPRLRETPSSRMLPVPITQEEKLRLMNERTALLAQVREIEDEKSAQLREFNRRVGELKAQLDAGDRKFRTGHEVKQVACRETVNLDDKTLTIVRLDSLDIIEKRPLTPEECQLTLADVPNVPAQSAAVA